MKNLIKKISEKQQKFIKIILSNTNSEIKKLIIRPIILKQKEVLQVERYIGTKVFHSTINYKELVEIPFDYYRQTVIETEGTTFQFILKENGQYRQKQISNNYQDSNKSHDKIKNYIFKEGEQIPALVELGIFNKDYKIINSKYDKFKQINKFIEIIDDEIKSFEKKNITILDFGCGKSYLTFLLYYYFHEKKKIDATIIGYDLKEDVVKNCDQLALRFGYTKLKFVVADVTKDKLYNDKIDMIISLHACDTATDFALNFAIKNNVKHIFSVPCCQHEINLSINKGGDFDIFLRDGLFKERFSALLTDAFRVEILRDSGYKVDVIEFVDFEHTPKNIMIRATKTSTKKSNDKLKELKNKYKFNQTLFTLTTEADCKKV